MSKNCFSALYLSFTVSNSLIAASHMPWLYSSVYFVAVGVVDLVHEAVFARLGAAFLLLGPGMINYQVGVVLSAKLSRLSCDFV
jgi:hypothetical protein